MEGRKVNLKYLLFSEKRIKTLLTASSREYQGSARDQVSQTMLSAAALLLPAFLPHTTSLQPPLQLHQHPGARQDWEDVAGSCPDEASLAIDQGLTRHASASTRLPRRPTSRDIRLRMLRAAGTSGRQRPGVRKGVL